MNATIEVTGLGKRYRLGQSEAADTLLAAAKSALLYPIRNFRELRSRRAIEDDGGDDPTILWALRDIDFTVAPGEVLGIIGHNGAGKSTLLKILSRITEPSVGQVALRGRVSSLLEVGTGFHDDLTGRDNVFMNGTILGMTRREVAEKFDEIVAFSGVRKHIDTPVKFYSSGMKVRLAFAVAAHLDPEILIIDEVLAVGDLAFQEKCLGKMNSVAQSGRTVLFVSHNMVAVEGLCSRCLVLEGGKIVFDGGVEPAIQHYRDSSFQLADSNNLRDREDREGGGSVRFTSVQFNRGEALYTHQPVTVDLTYEADVASPDLVIGVQFTRGYREVLMTINNRLQGTPLPTKIGENRLRITIPSLPLAPGNYLIDLWAGTFREPEDRITGAARVLVVERDVYGSGEMVKGRWHGYTVVDACEWELG